MAPTWQTNTRMSVAVLLYVDMSSQATVVAASCFAAGMYVLQLAGALLLALPGAYLLRRALPTPVDA